MSGMLGRGGAALRRMQQLSMGPRGLGGAVTSASASARRGMATERRVTWAEYRSGKATWQEWQDTNRPTVVSITLLSYVLLYLTFRRGGKKKATEDAENTEEAS